MPIRAKIFIALAVAAGVAVLGMACFHWHSDNSVKFGCYLSIAILASTMKVELPGIDSTMSVLFLFVLLGILELSLTETLVIGCSAALVQCFWKTRRKPEAVKVVFNVLGVVSNGIYLAYFAYHYAAKHFTSSMPLLLFVAACTFFLFDTLSVATVIALVEGRALSGTWTETYFWSFAYNLAGAAVVGAISLCNRYAGWQNALFALPIMYGVYRSYHLYLSRLEDQSKRVEVEKLQVEAEKRHVEEVCALHLRTIEGLALAIDAKDHTTHQHLYRVCTYAVEIAKELGLSEQDQNALHAAALLHDIGKLAVPDHIISKPGRLTSEEFEKVKIHPIVGADIVERVSFPYSVAPIVRSHHEKWNGKGYPDGLKGEEIPIGARILAAVDCLDALASDRQYRQAVPLVEAMRIVAEAAGTSFDPYVVGILQRRYLELEASAVRGLEGSKGESSSLTSKMGRGGAPAAGLELHQCMRPPTGFLSSIASARQEAYTLFELSQELGNSLRLDETLSVVAMRLWKLVPCDAIVVFIRKDDVLVPEFVSGEHFKMLSSLTIPVGTGLCGWVAQNERPIINGNPSVENGFTRDRKVITEFRSALAVPLVSINLESPF